ncbi:hypothetical protein MAPG_03593 [Magnaporthiopsis poae ATCC 64411]|uniref:Uncharacterized protein n=1 Tax=Magnaporthiopsis poae (strain ATCC 64411 / 73-15) TaxID=644358 RepID=A0A0C4DUF3_MAGP6|nr:hypothetical protein MAPG_03593 [Magnaporthiopsis poae ATCC 64411]
MATMGSIRQIWPQIPVTAGAAMAPEYVRLLDYFTASCHHAGLFSQNAEFATTNLAATLGMVPRIRNLAAATGTPLGQMTRDELLDGLMRNPDPNWRSTTDTHVANSLCLALSLWLALEISPSRTPNPGYKPCYKLELDNTTPLSDLIAHAIPVTAAVRASAHPHYHRQQQEQLDSRLTLEYLESYHGFRIAFTDNLAKHLYLQTGGGQKPLLFVFRLKIFLRNMSVYAQTSPLPPDLVGEALDTLNLVLPHQDPDTRKFLDRRDMADVYGLGWGGRPAGRILDLGRYTYWRDRLEELSAIVASGPTGLRQFKPGRGSGAVRDFVNFWMAIVAVIVLALASLGLSAASVAIGVMQYKLALAQACATLDSTRIPGWC